MWLVDLGSRSDGSRNHSISNYLNIFLVLFSIIRIVRLIHIMAQVDALLKTLELQESAKRKGHFALFKLFGAGAHQVQGCAAGLLQSVSVKNVLWKSSNGPRHDSAARHR